MTRDEIAKYTELTGEDGAHVPIIKLGAFLDGYEKGLEVLDKIREEIKSKKFGLTDTEDGRRIQSDIHAGFDGGIECALQIIDKYKAESGDKT